MIMTKEEYKDTLRHYSRIMMKLALTKNWEEFDQVVCAENLFIRMYGVLFDNEDIIKKIQPISNNSNNKSDNNGH